VLAIKALLGKTEADPRLLRQVVVSFEHHLNVDCKGGHPALRFKRRIHPMSQIVRLANDFDGLTRGRHDQRPLDVDEAVRHMLAGSGTAYHPGLLQLFIELVGGVYEPGTTPVPELQDVSPEVKQVRKELEEVRSKTPDDLSKIGSLEAMAAALAAMDLSAPASPAATARQASAAGGPPAAKPKKAKGVLGALKLKRIKKKAK
jgi:response regulator RpfG family c-di-GMP phosphodiesterase